MIRKIKAYLNIKEKASLKRDKKVSDKIDVLNKLLTKGIVSESVSDDTKKELSVDFLSIIEEDAETEIMLLKNMSSVLYKEKIKSILESKK